MKPQTRVFIRNEKVFAKVRGYPPWPARIVGVAYENKMVHKMKYHISFYGTNETAVTKAEDMFYYAEYKHKFGNKNVKGFHEAVQEVEAEMNETELEELNKCTSERSSSACNSSQIVISKTSKIKCEDDTTPKKSDEDTVEMTRSGRRVTKIKRFGNNSLDIDEVKAGDSNKEDPAPQDLLKRTNEQNALDENFSVIENDSLSFKAHDNEYKIPLNLNKPNIDDEDILEDWKKSVFSFAEILKMKIINSEKWGKSTILEMQDFTEKLYNEFMEKYPQIKIADESTKMELEEQLDSISNEQKDLQDLNNMEENVYFTIETKLVTAIFEIRNSLRLGNDPDVKRTIELLCSIQSLNDIIPLMLKKHPLVIETLNCTKEFCGEDSYRSKLNEKDRLLYDSDSEIIRSKSESILIKFAEIFGISFNEFQNHFVKDMIAFKEKTEHMTQADKWLLFKEP